MDFSHYTDLPAEFAAALVNTDQRGFDGTDQITDLPGLERFVGEYAELWKGEVADPTTSDLKAIRSLRDALREVFLTDDEHDAARLLNAILIENHATPRISVHGVSPHLHFEPSGIALAPWMAVVAAMGLATVVVEHGVSRFGLCDSDRCDDVYIDTSRNRSRRHCSTTCSTRENVAAHRRRQRDDPMSGVVADTITA